MRYVRRLSNARQMKWLGLGLLALALLAGGALDSAVAAKLETASPSRVATLLTPKNLTLPEAQKHRATPVNFYNVPGRGRMWCQVSGCRRPQEPGFNQYCGRYVGKNATQYPYYQFRGMVRSFTLRCNPPKTGGWVCCWRR